MPDSIKEVSLDKLSYENEQKLLLADDNAPKDYIFSALFKSNTIPTQKASIFSAPTIPIPQIKATGDNIIITLDINTPTFYDFLIEKRYYVGHNTYERHSTLYQGKFKNSFSDTIEADGNYTYTITPIYENTIGKSIILPTVSFSSDKGSISPYLPPEISKKDWWNY